MSVKTEEVDVRYCDICNERETRMQGISQCRRCRRDVCPNHWHLVGGDYISTDQGRWYANLCTDCRTEFKERLAPILAEFRPPEPAPAESRG